MVTFYTKEFRNFGVYGPMLSLKDTIVSYLEGILTHLKLQLKNPQIMACANIVIA